LFLKKFPISNEELAIFYTHLTALKTSDKEDASWTKIVDIKEKLGMVTLSLSWMRWIFSGLMRKSL